MKNISFEDVGINNGLWKTLQTKNSDVTIHAVKQRFYETGRFNAFSCDWVEGKDNKPHFYWESDIAKWIEGVSYILLSEKYDAEKMEEYIFLIDDVVDRIKMLLRLMILPLITQLVHWLEIWQQRQEENLYNLQMRKY